MPPYRQRPIAEQRRNDLARIDRMTVKITRVTGRVLVKGAGEVGIDVNFPVQFTERPSFTFGGELDDNSTARALSYPTVSAVVGEWTKRKKSAGFDGYYTGARLLIVTTGIDTQRLWVHWAMEAHAIRNPVNDVGSVEDAI